MAKTRFAGSVFWNLVGTIAAQASIFGVNIVVARLIGRAEFGVYVVIQSTAALLSQFAGLAMGGTATKYVAEYRSDDPARAGRILGICSTISLAMGGVTALLLLITAPWVAADILKAPDLTGELRVGSLVVLFTTMNGYQLGALAGLEGFPAMARARLLSGFLYVAICGSFTWVCGLYGALAGLLVSSCIQWLALGYHLRKECEMHGILISRRGMWKERGIISGFAIPAALNGIMTTPVMWLANVMLIRQTGGVIQMGVYTTALNLVSIVRLCPNVVDNVAIAVLNNYKGRQEGANFRTTFKLNIFLAILAVVVIGPLMLVFAPSILTLYGSGFGGATSVLRVLLIALLLEVLATAVYQIIRSHNQMWKSFLFIAIPQNVVLIGSSMVLSPRFGGDGLAWAYTVSWGVSLVATVFLVYRVDLSFKQKSIGQIEA